LMDWALGAKASRVCSSPDGSRDGIIAHRCAPLVSTRLEDIWGADWKWSDAGTGHLYNRRHCCGSLSGWWAKIRGSHNPGYGSISAPSSSCTGDCEANFPDQITLISGVVVIYLLFRIVLTTPYMRLRRPAKA
jgi:hypothetical protein